MTYTYFFTGYPGFLATNLLSQLIHDHRSSIDHIYLLVLPSQKEAAANGLSLLAEHCSMDPENFTIVEGDITKAELGIDTTLNHHLQKYVTHVFHLAAIYDLAVPRHVAFKVNVDGTHHMNEWVKTLEKLERYVYFSTAYVSGKREGTIYETELNEGQSFKNFYEETKYHAEVLVNDVKKTVPTTIIRPGITKGHSTTGQTLKFDGIYFMLNMFDRLSWMPVIPYIGQGHAEGNFIPYDYLLEATSYLATDPIGEGKTYHLTDPKPYTMRELYKMVAEAYLGKTPKGTIPLSWAISSLSAAPVRKWLQTEQEALDYFTINAKFDNSIAAADLADSGVTCPDFKDTIDAMIQFYRKYKHDRSRHITIG